MTNPQQSNLYWKGGPFHTRLGTHGNVPEDVLGNAVKFLDEYRGDCQKQYIAFNRVCNGRHLAYERYKSASNPANMDNTIFIGTAFPNSPRFKAVSRILDNCINEDRRVPRRARGRRRI